VAKATRSSEAYVYYVRWTEKKRDETAPKKAGKKAVYKSPRSRLVKDIFEMKKALDVVEKPKRVMINLARREDGAIIDLNKGGEVISPPDVVNHPPHYKAGGIETIDFIEAKDLNYRLGNVVKYVSRAGRKDSDPVQDLQKAAWYLQREIEARRNA
jgi:hypothetical protein